MQDFIRAHDFFGKFAGLRAALLCTATVVLPVGAGPAFAQAAPVVDSGFKNEIIVTAQRRSERLEDVPMSVAAIRPDALQKANVNNIQEIGRIAAGVQINFGGVSTQPAIRGVTSLTNGLGNENNVAVYVDGFYVPDNQSINSDLANLQSIQVLKGPQGTLYGRNATGGAILINTLDPSPTLTGKILASYGTFNEAKVSGYVSGPLTDRIRFMVAGASRESDGQIRKSNPTNNALNAGDAAPQEQRSVRLKLQADVTDKLTATLGYNYAKSSDANGVLFTPFDHVPASHPGGNLRATRFGTASFNYEAIALSESNEATLKLELDTGIGTLTSYTGQAWRDTHIGFDFDGTYADTGYSESRSKDMVFQQALDYSITAIDNLDLVVGAMYFHDKFKQDERGGQAFGPGLVLASTYYRPLETEAWAAYADATFHLTDKLSVGVGGRYSYDHKYVSQYNLNGAGAIIVPQFSRNKDFDGFTPRATIRYELAPRTNVYATYSEGFRAGSYNSSPAASAALSLPIEPEEIKSYEIGFKTAQDNFRFETAAFYYDYTNLNVSLTVPDPRCQGQVGCGVVTATGNAPKAEIYGIDAQVTYSPIERLNLTLGGAWVHARFGDFKNAIGTGLNAATNTNVSGQLQDWSGQQLARAPDFTANLNADYTAKVAGGDLLASGNVNYSDSYVISNPSLYGSLAGAALANKQRFRQDSYTLVNASLDWTDATERFTVGVFGRNLTDKSYRLTYNGGAFGDYSTKAPPATYGVRVGYKY